MTSAAATSIGVASRSATRVLRSSIPGLSRGAFSTAAESTPPHSTCATSAPLCANSVTSLEVTPPVWFLGWAMANEQRKDETLDEYRDRLNREFEEKFPKL